VSLIFVQLQIPMIVHLWQFYVECCSMGSGLLVAGLKLAQVCFLVVLQLATLLLISRSFLVFKDPVDFLLLNRLRLLGFAVSLALKIGLI